MLKDDSLAVLFQLPASEEKAASFARPDSRGQLSPREHFGKLRLPTDHRQG
jgi:hypothetical protein